MRLPENLGIVGADIRAWPDPKPENLPEAKRKAYIARRQALIDVVGGSSVRSAAQRNEVDERTVKKDAIKALETGSDGRVWGFRACTPFANRRPREAEPEQAPTHARAYALAKLLEATPGARELVEKYTGALPSGRVKARAFDRHWRAFLAIVRAEHGDSVYPFMLRDEGRGALLKHHKRLRRARRDAGAAEVDAAPTRITRLNQLFVWAPLERFEYDAHKFDVDWVLEMVRPDGHVVLRRITCINYLPLVCAGSRYIVAHLLVIGAYNRFDVVRLFRRALMPWTPRALIVPGLAYPEGARLGLPFDAAGCCPRGMLLAGDNALAHHADLTVANLIDHHRGIYHLGRARVPEARPIVEALNRRLEQGAIRHLAGSFQPESRVTGDGKTPTSYFRGADHPLHWEGLLDLIDVIAAGQNVTPHSGLGQRTPVSVVDAHLASGWSWTATEAARDARALTTVRFTARIAGSKAEGRQPFVQYHDARYRSQRLHGRWDLLKRTFAAEADIEDLRDIVLLDPTDGTPWSRLKALPPWDRTPHDLQLRQQIIRARNRGLFEIVDATDAVAAYHAFTRGQAITGEAPPDRYARIEAQIGPSVPPADPTTPRPTVLPRTGRTSFAHSKD